MKFASRKISIERICFRKTNDDFVFAEIEALLDNRPIDILVKDATVAGRLRNELAACGIATQVNEYASILLSPDDLGFMGFKVEADAEIAKSEAFSKTYTARLVSSIAVSPIHKVPATSGFSP